MTRVLMLGYGPLPGADVERLTSSILRTQQILDGVLAGGHIVNLFTLPLPGKLGADDRPPRMEPESYRGLPYQRFTRHSGEFALRTLQDMLPNLEPEAVVGVNTYPSYLTAMLPSTRPLWADLNGYWMAQMQGRCWAEGNDARLSRAWTIERTLLRRLDRFSAVSRPHLHAVLGELAAVGRLNHYTFHYQFGARIPPAWPARSPEIAADARAEAPGSPQGLAAGAGGEPTPLPLIRGPLVPEHAFIIAWTGSFAPWVDLETLMIALEELMSRHEGVHFIVAGGGLEEGDVRTWRDFEARVEASPHRNRFHRLGWLAPARLLQLLAEADLGLNVESANYDAYFAGRTRLAMMAAEGLPIATTIATELSEWLDEARAMLAARPGDPLSLVEAIEPWIDQREQLRDLRERARRLIRRDFDPIGAAEPLRRWLADPQLAPDNQAKLAQAAGRLDDLNNAVINELEALSLAADKPELAGPAAPPPPSGEDLADEDERPRRGRRRGWLSRWTGSTRNVGKELEPS